MKQLVQLQKDAAAFEKAGVRVVGVSYDKVSILKRFADRAKVKLTLLSDDGSKTIKDYGLHNTRGLPHPGTILIDKKGNIVARIFESGYKKRHPNKALLEAAEKLKKGE